MSNKSLVILLIVVVVLLGAFGVYYISSKNKTVSNTSTETSSTTADQQGNRPQAGTTEESGTVSTSPTSTNQSNMDNTTDLQMTTTKEGTGPAAKNGDLVSVNYTGTLTNGAKFDSSYDRNQPFSFQLGTGQVIQGWDKGVLGMKVGEKRHLVIPASMGYGAQAVGTIPANSVLIFDVEMVKIN